MKSRQSIFTAILMAVSLAAVITALNWDFKTALVPVICGGVVFTLCFFQLLRELRGKEAKGTQIMDSGFHKDATDRENMLGALQYFGWLVGLYISIWILGIYPSIGLFVVLYLLASRQVSLVKSVAVAAVIIGVVYVIINQIAQEQLPDPLLYEILF